MQFDRKITISAGSSRRAMVWQAQTLLISELWAKLQTPARGTEPLAEYENKETGKREIYIAQDGSHINQWGVLQYYEKLDSKANAKAMADALLDLYNAKTRTLKLQDVLGDIRVRAGTLLVVMLGLGDINVSNYLMAEQVKHTFNDGQHLMELKMRGGTFVA